jgi:hypothetical protein
MSAANHTLSVAEAIAELRGLIAAKQIEMAALQHWRLRDSVRREVRASIERQIEALQMSIESMEAPV